MSEDPDRSGSLVAAVKKARASRSQCGTYAGYQYHLKVPEDPCDACRQARDSYVDDYRKRTRGRADRRHSYAAHRALRDLKERHPIEYQEAYTRYAKEWEAERGSD